MQIDPALIRFWIDKVIAQGERRFLKISERYELAVEPITIMEYDKETGVNYEKTIGHRAWLIEGGRHTIPVIGHSEFTYKNTPDMVENAVINTLKSL